MVSGWKANESRGKIDKQYGHVPARRTTFVCTRMNAEEYANMDQMETAHWYYAGKRVFARGWLLRVRPPAATDLLLDCGAGTVTSATPPGFSRR